MPHKSKPPIHEFIVRTRIPPGATRQDVRDYIEESVATMCGCLRPPGGNDPDDPGNPLFMMRKHLVSVRRKSPSRFKKEP